MPILYSWDWYSRMASGTRGREATQVSQPLSFTFARSVLAVVPRISELIFK